MAWDDGFTRHGEADGSLADRIKTRMDRPRNTEQWLAWYNQRDNARLALHRAAMRLFNLTGAMWKPGGVREPTHERWASTTRRMAAAEQWLREMSALYGLDHETEEAHEHDWSAPASLRRHPVRAKSDTTKTTVGNVRARSTTMRNRRANEDGIIDPELVRRVIRGNSSPVKLNTPERITVAGLMAADDYTVTQIAKRLRCNSGDVQELIDRYRSRDIHATTPQEMSA
jgi:hypothetical protein